MIYVFTLFSSLSIILCFFVSFFFFFFLYSYSYHLLNVLLFSCRLVVYILLHLFSYPQSPSVMMGTTSSTRTGSASSHLWMLSWGAGSMLPHGSLPLVAMMTDAQRATTAPTSNGGNNGGNSGGNNGGNSGVAAGKTDPLSGSLWLKEEWTRSEEHTSELQSR